MTVVAALGVFALVPGQAANPSAPVTVDFTNKAGDLAAASAFRRSTRPDSKQNLRKVAASLTSPNVVTFNHPGEAPARSTTFETAGGPTVLPTPFMR